MTDSPIRPKLATGALTVVGGDPVRFQYNPEQVSRKIEPQMVGGQGDRSYGVRFVGAPRETIEMQLRVDAIDGLEAQDPAATRSGVANRLAQIELLAYPSVAAVARRESLLASGTIEILPDFAPLVLLVLGENRSMPVKIEHLAITEQTFDPNLNPIRATVDLSMHVLTYSDVLPSNQAYSQFERYQHSLVALAATVPKNSSGTG